MLCKDFEIKVNKIIAEIRKPQDIEQLRGFYELYIILSELLQVCRVLFIGVEIFPKSAFFTPQKRNKKKKNTNIKSRIERVLGLVFFNMYNCIKRLKYMDQCKNCCAPHYFKIAMC